MRLVFLALPALILAAPALAEPVRLVVSETHVDSTSGTISVELLALNADAATRDFAAPAMIDGRFAAANGASGSVRFQAAPRQASRVTIPPSGFVRLHYDGKLPAGASAGTASLTIAEAPAIALAIPESKTTLASAEPGQPQDAPPILAPPSAGSPKDNPFLANLSAYEPIYFVYGPGTDTAARIQISLKYQLLGRRGTWLDGITFAYTQRMFWDFEQISSPFRDVNYMPELFYLVPPRPVGGGGLAFGGRFGARHESNGRSGTDSRTLNTVYVQPEASIPIGGNTLTVGPRLWAYVGGQEGNEDIERYRGNAGLYAAFGEDDGLRLSLTSRLNFSSGKGAVDGVLSYPLTKAWAFGPQLYLIAQGFAGYGESLLDYNRKQTRARIGFGITR